MNVRPTHEHLDSFDVALLAELRGDVLRRQKVRTRRPRRALTVVGLAATTAVAFGVSTLGSPAAAYELTSSADGDIQITIHRLDDSARLEQDLAAKGITAHVDYRPLDASDPQTVPDPSRGSGDQPTLPVPDEPGAAAESDGSTTVRKGDGASSPCFVNGAPALSARPQGDSLVITIPKKSALHGADSALEVTTRGNLKNGAAGLTVDYTVNGILCQLGTFMGGR